MSVTTSQFWDKVCGSTISNPPTEATLVRPPRVPSVMPCVVAIAGLIIEGLRPILIGALLTAPLLSATAQTRRLLLILAAFVIPVMLWMRSRYHVGGREINPGIYGNFNNSSLSSAKRIERALNRAVDKYRPTPYLFNGHLRTIVPHILMHGSAPPHGLRRRWLPVDGQHIGLDILLPSDIVCPRGVLVLLHGLNGGSTESYVVDMYKACEERGYVACCMLGRGLAGTPFTGGPKDTFCPSRVSDVSSVINMFHTSCPGLPVHLAGWSLGGVVAANVVAKCGSELKGVLTSCVVVSGGLRVWEIFDSRCAVELWHPLLAFELKRSLLWRMVSLTGYEPQHDNWYYSCTNLLEVETALVAPAHGFDSVWDYYRAMSADDEGKCRDITVPTLIVHAADDPVIHVDSAGPKPTEEAHDLCEYLFAIITETGGHVGWPQGYMPWQGGFSWISNTAIDFADATLPHQTY